MKKRQLFWYILAVVYLVSPIDIVPDFLLGAGQVDDLFVLVALIAKVLADTGITNRLHDRTKSKIGQTAQKKVKNDSLHTVVEGEIVEDSETHS